MRDVLKSIDTIRQEADKRMRAQQSRQSGQQCGPVEFEERGFFQGAVVRIRYVMKSLDTIRQEADKRLRAQQSRQSGQQCGPVELRKKEDSFKAQPSPPSISSQTGQQTEKQNGDSSSTGLVMLRNALKFLDSICQRSDKRLRAQQSGEQCGPVELLKEEDSFKAQPSPPSISSQTGQQTEKQQPSPPSISSQTGQQTEKQVPSPRLALKSISSIQHLADQLMTSLSGPKCGPVELRKELDSFKAQETLKDRAEQPHPVVVGSPEQTTVAQKQQPSPPSVGSKTANENFQIQFGSVDDNIWEQFKNHLTTQKQQPSPPSISSQTGQQTEKQ
ncbi:hypothetical protein AAFF_G00202490 [Aldrovandia affinis]|uniref:Uncharacterized protein n=1 Tax=Aldrovandia affinis TaxID=143900 RepID=A0AAD7SXR9_9TELE|nr:hypothetical protein AAFF_G00202490 [Aldrovandia affinis]